MKENRLWYTAPAKEWNEAMPLGNGKLGMMVFGGIAEEQVQLNEETFWTGWEFDGYDSPETFDHIDEMRQLIFNGKYAEARKLCNRYMICRGKGDADAEGAFGSYQTAGELYLSLGQTDGQNEMQNYRRELLLDQGAAFVSCGSCQREYFVSPTYNTAVIRISGAAEPVKLRYERKNATILQDDNEIKAEGYLPTKFAVLIRKKVTEEATYIYITAGTNYKTEADPVKVCAETLDRAMSAGYDALRADTEKYFSEMLGRASISFPESGTKAEVPTNERIGNPENDLGLVELYFNFGRYLLLGSSRGKLPANLQGIWCKDYLAPWSADYHININIQMN